MRLSKKQEKAVLEAIIFYLEESGDGWDSILKDQGLVDEDKEDYKIWIKSRAILEPMERKLAGRMKK